MVKMWIGYQENYVKAEINVNKLKYCNNLKIIKTMFFFKIVYNVFIFVIIII